MSAIDLHDFFAWFGATSISVSLLIIAVLLLRKPVARRLGPEAAYLLWLLPAARLFLPELKILPAKPLPETVAAWTAEAPLIVFRPVDLATVTPAASIDWSALAMAGSAIVWIVGACAFVAWQLFRQHKFIRDLLASSTAPSSELIAEASVIAEKRNLKRRFMLRVAADDTGPLVAGLLRPVVVVPQRFEADFTPAERQLAIAHELAHIGRGDLQATFAAILFRALQWPNPLVHIAFRAFRADQEAACDAGVLARHRTMPNLAYAYGSAILKSAGCFTPSDSNYRSGLTAPAACLSMSHHLKERLMLMKSKNNKNALLGRAAAAAIIAAGLGLSASYAHADHHEKKIVERVEKSVSKQVIEVDGDETLEINGDKKARKIEITNENGDKTVKLYDKNGVLYSENVYGPDADLPFGEVVTIDEDGEKRTIVINADGMSDKNIWIMSGEDGMPPIPPLPPGAKGERRMVFVGKGADGEDGFAFSHCTGDGNSVIDVNVDTSETNGERIVMHRVICADGLDSEDPATRVEALEKVIAKMEEADKKAAEERAKTLANLKKQLADAKKEARKK